MKKIAASVILILVFALNSKAQYLEWNPLPAQRIFYGGDLGLALGTTTQIMLNPQAGYRITNRFSAGAGFNYMYVNSKYYNFKGSVWGGSIFVSFTLIKKLNNIISILNSDIGILLYAEYSYTNMGKYYTAISDGKPLWIASPMLGPSIQIPMSQRSYMQIMVLYNFNETYYSLYSNPVIKICYQF